MRKLVVLLALVTLAAPASATTTRILAPMDWWPVWSPDGTHVAFTRVYPNRMELWVLDLHSHRTSHVGTSAGQLEPSWSHDSSRIAYSSGGVLREADADGSGKAVVAAPGPAYAPAWRPTSGELAYLTTYDAKNLDLWVGDRLWARNVVGSPAWTFNGVALAFQRDDGIYVMTEPGAEKRIVTDRNPGPPAWSYEGNTIAYAARGAVYIVDAIYGGTPSLKARPMAAGIRVPSWSIYDARVSGDRAWSPVAGRFVQPGPRTGCPGHTVLLEEGKALTGSCLVTGTAKADVIEGTPLWGDQIVAGSGNDRIHANDGHTDRVNCGPGRDEVWADRTDRLTACEVIHR